MISKLRKRVTYVNVAMTVALVFAMSGGAFAAGKYLIVSTKQISPKVLKSLQGKAGAPGASGAQGPAGSAGPVGPQGPAGAKGENGAAGSNGTNGTNGTSVASKESKATIGPCKEGGSEFKAGSATTYACNGEKGKEGTFGGQSLPSGQTLRGVYGASGFATEGLSPPGPGTGEALVAASFPLPVAGKLAAHYIKEREVPPAGSGCTGNENEPGAEPGNLCLFSRGEANAAMVFGGPEVQGTESVSVGFLMTGVGVAAGRIGLEGTWAVTAK